MTPPRPTAVLVWGRAFALATVGLLTGAVSHVSAGGLVPHPAVLSALLLWGTALCGPLCLRRLPTPAVVALVVAGQALCHTALSVLAGHEGSGPSALDGGLLRHEWEHLTVQSPGMVLGHVLAAATVGLWLARGEHAVWQLLALASARTCVAAAWDRAVSGLRTALRGLAEAARRAASALPPPARPTGPPPLLRPLQRRGPPTLLAS